MVDRLLILVAIFGRALSGHAAPADQTVVSPDPYAAVQALQSTLLDAALALQRALPESEEPLTLLGILYHGINRDEQAVATWRRSLRRNPRQVDTLNNLARVALERGDVAGAIQYWERAVAVDPDKPGLRLGLAEACLAQGDPDRAVAVLEEEGRRCGLLPATLALLGRARLEGGNYAGARENLLAALPADPNNPDLLYGLMVACRRLGDVEEARTFARRFQRHRVSRQDLRDLNAETYHRQVRASAVTMFLGMAQVYANHNHAREAAELYERVLTLEPTHRDALKALFRLYQRIGRRSEAVEMIRRCAALDPGDANLLRAWGTLALKANRLDQAREAFRQLIALRPGLAPGYRGLAQAYIQAKEHPAEALRFAQKAVALDPAAESYYLLCWAWLRNGDRVRALDALDRAIQLNPAEARYRRLFDQIRSLP